MGRLKAAVPGQERMVYASVLLLLSRLSDLQLGILDSQQLGVVEAEARSLMRGDQNEAAAAQPRRLASVPPPCRSTKRVSRLCFHRQLSQSAFIDNVCAF